MKYIKYPLWSVVIIIMCAIFIFSAQNGEKSDGVSNKISTFITGGQYVEDEQKIVADWTDSWGLNGVIRKFAHFCVYLFLGLFLFLALIFTFDKKEAFLIALTLIVCLLYATSDEIHQFFVGGRSGSLKDVLIDFSGSSIGAFIALFIKNKYLKHYVK